MCPYFFACVGSCEGGCVSVCGFFVWGILRVWGDFMVCVLCGVLRVGESSSSILYGTWVRGEGFPFGALCFLFLSDFF